MYAPAKLNYSSDRVYLPINDPITIQQDKIQYSRNAERFFLRTLIREDSIPFGDIL